MALLDLLGRRWALRTIWELRDGPLPFRALQERCAGMSSSVLNQRLRELRAAGVLDAGAGGYRLTDEGRRLLEAVRSARRLGRALGSAEFGAEKALIYFSISNPALSFANTASSSASASARWRCARAPLRGGGQPNRARPHRTYLGDAARAAPRDGPRTGVASASTGRQVGSSASGCATRACSVRATRARALRRPARRGFAQSGSGGAR